MSSDKPPYTPGEVDTEALEHVVDQIMNPATELERLQWESTLTKMRGRPWWRRMLGLPSRKVVLPVPPAAADPERAFVPPDEGFFAARHDEIDDDLVEDGPHGRFRTVEVKQMDPVKVATLGETLGAGHYDTLVEPMLTSDAREAPSGECGTYVVPDAIRDALANTSDVAEVAERWVRTEELQLDHWTIADARELLGELQPLARDARANGKSLYVWWTL